MKNRKIGSGWIHGASSILTKPKIQFNGLPYTTVCGKTARQFGDFRDPVGKEKMNNITCTRCIDILRKQYWYCDIHRFLEFNEVTNDEKCSYCGGKV